MEHGPVSLPRETGPCFFRPGRRPRPVVYLLIFDTDRQAGHPAPCHGPCSTGMERIPAATRALPIFLPSPSDTSSCPRNGKSMPHFPQPLPYNIYSGTPRPTCSPPARLRAPASLFIKVDLYGYMGDGAGPDRILVRKIPNVIYGHPQICIGLYECFSASILPNHTHISITYVK